MVDIDQPLCYSIGEGMCPIGDRHRSRAEGRLESRRPRFDQGCMRMPEEITGVLRPREGDTTVEASRNRLRDRNDRLKCRMIGLQPDRSLYEDSKMALHLLRARTREEGKEGASLL